MQLEVGNGSAPTRRTKSAAGWHQRWLLAGLLVSTLDGAGAASRLCDAMERSVEGELLNLTEIKQLLLAPYADPNAFCEGCFNNHSAAVLVFGHPWCWSSSHWTPLHIAAAEGRVDITDTLLQRGAKIDKKNDLGDTPLHLAARARETAVVVALLNAGAKTDEKNNDGRTALHAAANGGSLAVVKVLVANNADVLATDLTMETPGEIASTHGRDSPVAEWLRMHGGAAPTPTSFAGWAHVLRFHPWSVAACVGGGVLLAGFTTGLEWTLPGKAGIATQDPSPALVGGPVPSNGALRLAAQAIAKGGRYGSLIGPAKLMASSFAVCGTLLFACGPCMWIWKPLIIVMAFGPAFLVPAVCTFGWREVVKFPALVMAAKTPAGRCCTAVTTLLVTMLLLFLTVFLWFQGLLAPHYLLNARLAGNVLSSRPTSGLASHGASFSLGSFHWHSGLRNMMSMHWLLQSLVILMNLAWVLGVAVTSSRCCRLPVASRTAVEELAGEIDNASTPDELRELHPALRPEGLFGLAMKMGFAALDLLLDLNTIVTFIVTCNFWFAFVLWTVFLASLGSEVVRGNVQALPREFRRSLATGVMTDRLIEFLDSDKGFEAPFSLAITMYAMPFVARTGTTFLTQCFSLLTSSVGIAGFLNDYLALATLSDEPGVTTHQLCCHSGPEVIASEEE